MLILFFALSAPALVSYTDLLPYYERSKGLSYLLSAVNSFDIGHTATLIAPWPAWSSDQQSITDPTGRSLFIGVVPLVFALCTLQRPLGFRKAFLWTFLVVSFLYILGQQLFIHKFFYRFIPGFSLFRHPSHFRLYVVLALLLLAVIGIDSVQKNARNFKLALLGVGIITIAAILYNWPFNLNRLVQGLSFTQPGAIKTWLIKARGNDLAAAALFLQLVFLAALFWFSRNLLKNLQWLLVISVANLFIFQSLLPVTLVSQTSPKKINSIIAGLRRQKPDALAPIGENSAEALRYFNDIGLAYFYSPRPGLSKVTNSPSFLRHQGQFLEHDFLYRLILSKPMLYLTGNTRYVRDTLETGGDTCTTYVSTGPVHSFSCTNQDSIFIWLQQNNNLVCHVRTTDSALLNLSQNYHHNWHVAVDGKKASIIRSNIAFMSVLVPPGDHVVEWKYYSPVLSAALVISIIALLLCLPFLFLKGRRHEK